MIDSNQGTTSTNTWHTQGRAMQVFTRGVDEGLVIGDSVQINVLEVQNGCVRLAIIDPEGTPTYREELLYLPSEADECENDFELCSIFSQDEDFQFEDQDSRLIRMV